MTRAMFKNDEYIDETTAAKYLGITRASLQKIRLSTAKGDKRWKPVPHYKFGKYIRYRKEDLDGWLRSHKTT